MLVEPNPEVEIFRRENVRLRKALEAIKVKRYAELAEGLRDMIDNNRLTETDIPDDYQWLVLMLDKACQGVSC